MVEIVDSVLSKERKMSALIESFFEQREARKRVQKSFYDMDPARPDWAIFESSWQKN